jgi:hypothetical protein
MVIIFTRKMRFLLVGFQSNAFAFAMVAGLNPQQGRQRNPAYWLRQFTENGESLFLFTALSESLPQSRLQSHPELD